MAAFSSGPSAHIECLAEDTFVDDVRGGVLETERIKQARPEEVQRCRGMKVWDPVLRKSMDAAGAKVVPLSWIDTDKGDAEFMCHEKRSITAQQLKKDTKCQLLTFLHIQKFEQHLVRLQE